MVANPAAVKRQLAGSGTRQMAGQPKVCQPAMLCDPSWDSLWGSCCPQSGANMPYTEWAEQRRWLTQANLPEGSAL